VLTELAERILAVETDHPTRVAVDGCSAAGKSTLADDLGEVLRRRTRRPLLRVQLDQFKRAVERRTRYPLGTPESYYFEMFDVEAIREVLLLPLGPGGDRRYRSAIMDFRGRTPIDAPVQVAPEDAILLADGGFLQKPELYSCWDLRIYLDIDFADVQRRGTERDQAFMESAEAAAERYRTYYVPGEQRYVAEIRPAELADIVVDNRDFAAPRIVTDRRGPR
jgi:uridine kinase